MKNLKIKRANLFRLMAIICCMAFPMICLAQGPPDPCDNCPIDGGLSALIAAGVGYGIKKYRDGKKKQVNEAMG